MAVLNVQVPDVAQACARVEELGGAVAVPLQSTPLGLDFAYVTDPDGNVFGVWTPPDAPATACRSRTHDRGRG
jgi:predicted enzyme related to lactoylglutathione lyase